VSWTFWGNDNTGDFDGDGICDDGDLCIGPDGLGDVNNDGFCDGAGGGGTCTGDLASGDSDNDGICDNLDPCDGDPLNDGDGDGVCHSDGDCDDTDAGIRPGVPLEQQSREDLFWIRKDFLDCREPHPFVVVHGHTPSRLPQMLDNRICLDTGAFATGRLTCGVFEGTERRLLNVNGRPV